MKNRFVMRGIVLLVYYSLGICQEYRQTVSLTFNYGEGREEFGVFWEAGGGGVSSFTTDDDNNLYVLDDENIRLKVFDTNGNMVRIVDGFRQRIKGGFTMADIALFAGGNMLILSGYSEKEATVYYCSPSGKLLNSISVPMPRVYDYMYLCGDNLFTIDSDQKSQLVGVIDKRLREPDESVLIEGKIGSQGNVYRCRLVERGKMGEITVHRRTGEDGTIRVDVDGLASLVFLTEDREGYAYIQIERSVETKPHIKLEVHRYDLTGRLLNVVPMPNHGYDIYTLKLLHVNDETGDIWQVMPGKEKVYINKWSMYH